MPPLPAQQHHLWTQYVDAENRNVRDQSLPALKAFLDSLETLPLDTWRDWAYDISHRAIDLEDPFPIRMPLLERALFPMLLKGLNHQQPQCARWLAGFSNQLCHRPRLREQLHPHIDTPYGLLRHALTLDPTDSYTRRHLIRQLTSQLKFSLHEIPSGVLYDHGQGATIEQCQELLNDTTLLKELLSTEPANTETQKLLTDSQFHFTHYQHFLAHQEQYQDYPHYLAANS